MGRDKRHRGIENWQAANGAKCQQLSTNMGMLHVTSFFTAFELLEAFYFIDFR